MLRPLLRFLANTYPSRSRQADKRCPLRLENLESREVPAFYDWDARSVNAAWSSLTSWLVNGQHPTSPPDSDDVVRFTVERAAAFKSLLGK